MTKKEILKGIQHVFDQYLKIDIKLEPQMDILYDLQLDSLELTTLVVEMENHFKVAFEEGDELGLNTIDDLVCLVDTYLNAQHDGSNE